MSPEDEKARKTVYNKRWRDKHKVELLAKEQKWREERREELREKSRKWRLANIAKSLAWGRAGYKAKRDDLVDKKRAYNAARKDEINAKSRSYRTQNLVKVLERSAKYRDANREALREKGRAYQKTHPEVTRATSMRRIARKINATPAWVDHKAINAIYKECVRITQETGVRHSVDHIYPLHGRTVCGLHVSWNLRVITYLENCRKLNRLPSATEFPIYASVYSISTVACPACVTATPVCRTITGDPAGTAPATITMSVLVPTALVFS